MARFGSVLGLFVAVILGGGSASAQYLQPTDPNQGQIQQQGGYQQGYGQQGQQQGQYQQQQQGTWQQGQQPGYAQPGDPAATTTPAGQLPTAIAERPLTLPAMNLRIDADLTLARICFQTIDPITLLPTSSCGTAMGFGAGAGFGITDDLEVGLIPIAIGIPIDPTGDPDYGNPHLYGRFRFLRGNFEMGAELGITFITSDDVAFLFTPGVPMRVHLGTVARLDFGLFIPIGVSTADGADPFVGLSIPIELLINITPSFWLGPHTGFNITNFDGAGDNIVVPFGARVGVTIPAGNAPIDLYAAFEFPAFIQSGGGDAIFVDLYTFGLGADIHLNFN